MEYLNNNNKDIIYKEPNYKKKESTIDLHGFSLDQANKRIEKLEKKIAEKKIKKKTKRAKK